MKKRADILLVGQTPPPYHGQSIVTAMLFEHDWPDLDVVKIRMGYSDSIDNVGRFSLRKVWHLWSLIFKTWKVLLTHEPKVLYYLPASANKIPIFRDVCYLAMVRLFFRKTVFHFHAGGLPSFLDQSGFIGVFARLVYSKADLSIDVVKTEPPTGSYFQSRKNVVINNGVDVDLVSRKRDSEEVFRILFIGVLNEGKGVKDIVVTASKMKERGCRCEFYIVGEWSSPVFQEEIEKLVEENELEGWIYFTGPLQGGEKWQAYANADCFFFPSHYEAETFGLVLVEAMAFGLPLVTTRWRGIPHVVRGGECAYLCDTHSPDQYADALVELAGDTALRSKMGQAAKRHYQKNYTRECFLKGMEKVFWQLAKV